MWLCMRCVGRLLANAAELVDPELANIIAEQRAKRFAKKKAEAEDKMIKWAEYLEETCPNHPLYTPTIVDGGDGVGEVHVLDTEAFTQTTLCSIGLA